MREILFRGKRADNNEWIYGGYMKNNNGIYIVNTDKFRLNSSYKNYLVFPKTMSQFTGLYDKNGKMIFENDIVKWSDNEMVVFWGEDIGIGYGFCWKNIKGDGYYHESITGFIDEYEVIGNIFDKEVQND